jgi:hypothetical protein
MLVVTMAVGGLIRSRSIRANQDAPGFRGIDHSFRTPTVCPDATLVNSPPLLANQTPAHAYLNPRVLTDTVRSQAKRALLRTPLSTAHSIPPPLCPVASVHASCRCRAVHRLHALFFNSNPSSPPPLSASLPLPTPLFTSLKNRGRSPARFLLRQRGSRAPGPKLSSRRLLLVSD